MHVQWYIYSYTNKTYVQDQCIIKFLLRLTSMLGSTDELFKNHTVPLFKENIIWAKVRNIFFT